MTSENKLMFWNFESICQFTRKGGQISKNWRRYDVLNPILKKSWNFYAFLAIFLFLK